MFVFLRGGGAPALFLCHVFLSCMYIMKTYISILRGINVSGHKMIKMDELKKTAGEIGFEQISTYIQSGNLVFNSKRNDTSKISKLLSEAIKQKFGFEVPVITMTKDELQQIIEQNPFLKQKELDEKHFHLTILDTCVSSTYADIFEKIDLKNDKAVGVDRVIYLYCPDGYSNTKLSNAYIENKLKVRATTRNWKTINELNRIADAVSSLKT